MSLREAIRWNLLRRAWRETLACMRRPRALGPFAAYGLLQLLMLIGFVNLHEFPFSRVFLPLQKMLFGERALHYPNNFVVLPSVMDLCNLALSGLIGIVVIGAATRIFYFMMGGDSPEGTLRPVLARYGHLFVIWLIEIALVLAVMYGMARLQPLYPNWTGLLTALRVGIVMLIMSVFAYSVAVVVLEGTTAIRAIGISVRIFIRWWGLTFLLVTLPSLLRMPLSLLLNDAPRIVENMAPEVIPVLLGGEILFSIFVNFLIIGSITHVYRTWKLSVGASA
ncbi:hypothetical protein D6833_00370 [Candidatus Parcubacteria bacterium]|nr:MAG: hypothetical protein D6833_00370 [Candidatus Parcubacteria bacterium]